MNLFTGQDADEFFGGCEPGFARELLHQAASAPRAEAGALLWAAQALAPQTLGIYYALYKHHAGRREFEQAGRAARRGLAEAALQVGLPADWRLVVPGTLPAGIDFQGSGAARFWLFTLKALAFIALRSERADESRALLARIAALAPDAHIGDDVIATLLASVSAGASTHLPGNGNGNGSGDGSGSDSGGVNGYRDSGGSGRP